MTEDLGRRLVDPQLVDMLDGFAPLVLSPELLPALREVCRQPAPLHANQAPRAETVEALAPGPAGAPDAPVSITRPLDAPGPWPCVLHLHGGGYVVGAPSADAPQHRVLAAALGCCIISVDYRLAPETPFPGAIEDAYAVLNWAWAQAPTLNLDPGRIGVMGESAGGGLAAALALLARDRGGPSLAFQHLIYPMIDDRTCVAADPHPFAGAYLWTPHNNRFGWTALLGRAPGGPDVSPYAAAARATLLSGLPPTFISTGALDLFLEEDLDYARRLTRAGVPVELHVYPGGFHAFDFHPSAEVAIQARRDSLEALRRAFRPRRPRSI
jgi:triacylglycerol lipase